MKSNNKTDHPPRKRKTELVFDENKRKEFLTGFHKRKVHRQKVAKIEYEKKLKEEAHRIKLEAKDSVKKLYHSFKPIPELKDLVEEEEYDTENVTVKVVELSTAELAKQNNWIGENSVLKNQNETSEDEAVSEPEEAANAVPGMELDEEKPKKNKKLSEVTTSEKPEKENTKSSIDLSKIRSKKDLNSKVKKQTLKSMQKSKVFKQKERMQRIKNVKKSKRENYAKEKMAKKKNRGKDNAKEGANAKSFKKGKGKKRR